jgi:lipopolysaccharide transport system permease protein
MNESLMKPSAGQAIPESTASPLPNPAAEQSAGAPPSASASANNMNGTAVSPVLATDNERLHDPAPKYVKVIEPPSGWPAPNLAELWQYRDLLFLLIWRDISATYRQSIIGYGWAVFKAVTQTAAGTLVFSIIAGLEGKPGVPYPVLIFVGIMPWMYFSNSLNGASGSLAGSAHLVSKVYFPRLILPLSSLGSGLVDFGIQFVLLLAVLPIFVGVPGWTILLAPVFLAACMLTALSLGLWLTALNVKYRDIGHLVPFLIQMGMWVTPVYYLSEKLSSHMGSWGWLLGLNPMTGVIEGFRWAMLGSAGGIEPPNWSMMAVSLSVVAFLLVSGLYFFRRVEGTFVDVI